MTNIINNGNFDVWQRSQPKQLENGLGKVLNDEFQGKIFRIKGFGPAKLDRFEFMPANKPNYTDYKLHFKSIFDHKRWNTTVSVDSNQPAHELLPYVIRQMFEICEQKDITDMDYLLFKREEPTKPVDFGRPLTKQDLDDSIKLILGGTTMAPKGSLVMNNPRAVGVIKNVWVDEAAQVDAVKLDPAQYGASGTIIMTSTPRDSNWMKEYAAMFEPIKDQADRFKGLEDWLEVEDGVDPGKPTKEP